MPIEIADRLTPVTTQKFIETLYMAWVELLGEVPKLESLLVLAAKSALETGRWRYMHNYNIGNAKCVEGDGHDYSYFACNEILPVSTAKVYAEKTPDTAKITKIIPAKKAGGMDYAEIWFYPKHPGCKFRAYDVRDENGAVDEDASFLKAMIDYLRLLRTNYMSCWEFVLNGDPDGFVRAIKARGYFTAPLDSYLHSVISIFNEFSKLQIDLSQLPVLSSRQKKAAMDAVLLSMQDSLLRSKIT